MTLRLFVVTVALLYATILYSQQDSLNTDSLLRFLEEVTVSAQKKPVRNLLIPYSVNVISKAEFRQLSLRTTPEALMAVNGVFVQKTNHGGGSAFIRGLTGNQTLVLVDGIRLNNSTFRYGPNQYLNTIDLFSISRIEIAKGTGSVQYGSDAMGGVIHVITAQPKFGTNYDGEITGRVVSEGMEKTVRGTGSFGGKTFAINGGITYRDFGHLIGGDSTGVQSPSGYEEIGADVKAKIAVNQNLELVFANQFVRQIDVPVYHKIRLESFAVNKFEPQQRSLTYAKANLGSSNRLFEKVSFSTSFQQHLEGRESQKNGSKIMRREKDRVNTLGLTADIFSRFNNLYTANSGIEFYHDKISSSARDVNINNGTVVEKRGLYPDNSRFSSLSLYTLHRVQVKRWIMDGGIRVNFFNIAIKDSVLGEVGLTPSAVIGNIAVMYQAGSGGNIFASFSSGYRAPNIDDMGSLGIVDFRYEIPSANLKPERSYHTEAGYKYSGKSISATAAFFYMQLRDLITRLKMEGRQIEGYQVYSKENTENAFIKGVEAELQWRITKKLLSTAAFSYQYGHNSFRNEPLRRIPPLNGRLVIQRKSPKWFAAIETMFAADQKRLAKGDRDDNRIPAGGTPGWHVLNVYGGVEISAMRINFAFNNLFNTDYRTHGSGINGIGRSMTLTVNYQL